MANIKSQIKRNKQNENRRRRNRVYRGAARSSVKKARVALDAANAEEARVATMQAVSLLDKAAQKGAVHKKNATRRKSRLMKRLAGMPPKPVEVVVVEEKKAKEKPKTEKKTTRSRKKSA